MSRRFCWRFMSGRELLSYLKGNTIEREFCTSANTTGDYNSIFCFSNKIRAVATSNHKVKIYTPFSAMDFMYGIVDAQYLVKFSTSCSMNKSIGTYADYINKDARFLDTMMVDELCIDKYDTNIFKLEKVYKMQDGSYYDVDFDSLMSDSFILEE